MHRVPHWALPMLWLQVVPDRTGREDLVRHLRTRLLLQAAQAAGCNKLLLGDTGTRVAAQVIAAAAKGRGYALPGDVQWVDARWVPWAGSSNSAQLGLLLLTVLPPPPLLLLSQVRPRAAGPHAAAPGPARP